jgi:hypothetical protein
MLVETEFRYLIYGPAVSHRLEVEKAARAEAVKEEKEPRDKLIVARANRGLLSQVQKTEKLRRSTRQVADADAAPTEIIREAQGVQSA